MRSSKFPNFSVLPVGSVNEIHVCPGKDIVPTKSHKVVLPIPTMMSPTDLHSATTNSSIIYSNYEMGMAIPTKATVRAPALQLWSPTALSERSEENVIWDVEPEETNDPSVESGLSDCTIDISNNDSPDSRESLDLSELFFVELSKRKTILLNNEYPNVVETSEMPVTNCNISTPNISYVSNCGYELCMEGLFESEFESALINKPANVNPTPHCAPGGMFSIISGVLGFEYNTLCS